MKTIYTDLTEKQFLKQLDDRCYKKENLLPKYADIDAFVYKLKNKKFWILQHYAEVGRSHGYANDRLVCKYFLDEKENVVVKYRYGKDIGFTLFGLVCLIFTTPVLSCLIFDAFTSDYIEIPGILILSVFFLLGIGIVFTRSKEVLRHQEERLYSICNIKYIS